MTKGSRVNLRTLYNVEIIYIKFYYGTFLRILFRNSESDRYRDEDSNLESVR